VGGIVAPFIFIKLIDLILTALKRTDDSTTYGAPLSLPSFFLVFFGLVYGFVGTGISRSSSSTRPMVRSRPTARR